MDSCEATDRARISATVQRDSRVSERLPFAGRFFRASAFPMYLISAMFEGARAKLRRSDKSQFSLFIP